MTFTPTPIGQDQRVNEHDESFSGNLSVVALNGGGFVVTWASNDEVYAQQFTSAGVVVGERFQVNTVTKYDQLDPSIAALQDGGFIITWSSYSSYNTSLGSPGIYGQRYNSDGDRLGDEFGVHTSTAGFKRYSSVASLADGGFVVTWDAGRIFAQRYDAAGIKVGGELLVDVEAPYTEADSPTVVGLAEGGFVITWSSLHEGDEDGLMAQHYDSEGAKLGDGFQVNSETIVWGYVFREGWNYESIAALRDGGFVVTWSGNDVDGKGVKGQRFNSESVKVGDEFLVNTETDESQNYSTVTALADGGFVVSWASSGQTGSRDGMYGQRFSAAGIAVGDEFRLNSPTDDRQGTSGEALTTLANGQLVGVWNDYGTDRGAYIRLIDVPVIPQLMGTVTVATASKVSFGSGEVITFYVSFDEGVIVSGMPTLSLTGYRSASFAAIIDTNTVSFTYQVRGDEVAADMEVLGLSSDPLNTIMSISDVEASVVRTSTLDISLVDTSRPDAPEVVSVSSDTGGDTSDAVTSDNTLIIKGVAEKLSSVNVFLNGDSIGAVAADKEGNWLFDHTATQLSEGNYEVTARATDESGNEGPLSSTFDLVVDDTVVDATPLPSGNDILVSKSFSSRGVSSITALEGGGFVMTFRSASSSEADLYGQRYTAEGVKDGLEFKINSSTQKVDFSSVSAFADGGFLVAWRTKDADIDIYTQRYDFEGVKVGDVIQVNNIRERSHYDPVSAVLANGDFMVVWNSNGANRGIYAQRYDSSGEEVSEEIKVTSAIRFEKYDAKISALSGGGFVVTWGTDTINTDIDVDDFDIYGQLYNAVGVGVGKEFLINTQTISRQESPVIASLSDGGFVVIWESIEQDGSSYGVYGQRYSFSGEALGGEFQVNTETQSYQYYPSVKELADGGFVVAWLSEGQDGSGTGVYGQRFSAAGAAIGEEFRLNSITEGDQYSYRGIDILATLKDGRLVATWKSNDDVFLRFIDIPTLPPVSGTVTLAGETVGDASFESGETIFFEASFDEDVNVTGSPRLLMSGSRSASFVSVDDANTLTFAYTLNERDATIDLEVKGLINDADNNVISFKGTVATISETTTLDINLVDISAPVPPAILSISRIKTDPLTNTDSLTVTGISEGFSNIGIYLNGNYAGKTITTHDGQWSFDYSDTLLTDYKYIVTAKATDRSGNESVESMGFDLTIDSNPSALSPMPKIGDISVDTSTTVAPRDPAVAPLADGGFVVTWGSYKTFYSYRESIDLDANGIFGQLYSSTGEKVGTEFRINSELINYKSTPSITSFVNGDFVVSWTSANQDSSGFGIYGQRYTELGETLGGEFRINTETIANQENSSITSFLDGSFVVVWTSEYQGGSGSGIYGQRFDSEGVQIESEFLVNTHVLKKQVSPSVTILLDNGFVVTWSSQDQDGSGYGIYGQRYTADAQRLGEEFQVNTMSIGDQDSPSITGLLNGGFVVTWSSYEQDGDDYGIYGQIYTSEGIKLHGEIQINTETNNTQQDSSVVALPDGGFVVSWTSFRQEGGNWNSYAQRFSASGADMGLETRLNLYTGSYQKVNEESIAVLADGSLVAAWVESGDIAFRLFDLPTTKTNSNHAPVLLPELAANQIDEMSANGTIIGSVVAIDLDNDELTYSLNDNAEGRFSIDANTGIISVADGLALDFEQSTSHLIGVTVNDGAVNTEMEYTISVNDVVQENIYDDAVDRILVGGDGNDFVRVWQGSNSFDGGAGKDYISYHASPGGVNINLATNVISGSWADDDSIQDFESVTGSKYGADRIIGTDSSNTIRTSGGNDVVHAGKGNDKVYLGGGSDFLWAGGGAEFFDGGAGKDHISYYDSPGGVSINLATNVISGSWADDDVLLNFESVTGSKVGADTLMGTEKANTLRGSGGDDQLYGDLDNDKLFGGAGQDFLAGGAGNDILYGSSFSGDSETDVFYFEPGAGSDVIKDFEDDIDIIDLASYGFSELADAMALATQEDDNVVFEFSNENFLIIENSTLAEVMDDLLI